MNTVDPCIVNFLSNLATPPLMSSLTVCLQLESAGGVLSSLPERLRVVVACRTLSLAACKLQLPFYPEMVRTLNPCNTLCDFYQSVCVCVG